MSLLAVALTWAPTGAGGDAPARPEVTLRFTSVKGSLPRPEAVPIRADAGEVEPAVQYDSAAGWLRATISQTPAARSLIVEPRPFRLGPGLYHATIDLGGAAHSTARIDVALAVLASTHASCPPKSMLRYDGGGNGGDEPVDFGRTFFATYCISCHASANVGNARSGAPRGLDWDSLPVIRRHLYGIDEAAARGPHESHDDMPPREASKHPTDAERALLGRWIACGAP